MPGIQPAYIIPPVENLWAQELVRQLRQRDFQVNNEVRRQTGFLATTNAVTAFNSGTAADVTFATEVVDAGNRYDGNKIYYAPIKGLYTFTATLTFDATATVSTDWLIVVKTTDRDYEQAFTTPATGLIFSASITIPCALININDTAKVQIQRLAGAGTITLVGDHDRCRFSGHLLEVA